jgi:hypothetical protein
MRMRRGRQTEMNILVKLYDAVTWAIEHPRLTLELALVGLLLFIGWRYNRAQDELSKSRLESGQLEEGLRQEIRVRNGQLEVLRKEKGKVVVERVYVPPEGAVFIKQKDLEELHKKYRELLARAGQATTPEERERLQREIDRLMGELNKPDTEIVVRDKGFTLRPGFGVEWAGQGIGPRLDLKWAYYKRYSFLVGGGKSGADVSISRHIDDLVWGRPQNVEVFGGWKFLRMPGASQVVFGLRANF